ncbi:sulfotransferase [Roseibacterium beibuensis]|uniref:Sulfotransferase n=1 Tax=[Roseibacterium] beibuensis TaxID=1193142 RepID=A0ABP9LDL9_9RHOB|nr:sulfotransferase [Roseibacterium beibuensis]MCS6623223.1 sulfotransferase [Roseibacterium beibuensis]
MKPDFIFVGPHKSGTTWIDNYLRSRGDVQLPVALGKETFFFDKLYHKGWDWYSGTFGERSSDHKICVEVAPSLLDKPEAIERVAKDIPDVTIIATLRNPIDRAIAHYFHYLKGGEPDRGFRWMAEHHPAMIENGLYYRNLNWWAEALGRDQIKLLNYHDLNDSPSGYVSSICKVLNLPEVQPSDDVLYARINEDGDPRVRFLAKIARRSARTLRLAGVHWLVNAVRQPAVRRAVYGPPPAKEKRERIREEANTYFYDLFFEDFSKLDDAYGFDTSAWRVPKPVSENAEAECDQPLTKAAVG